MWPKDLHDPHQEGGLVRGLWPGPQKRRLAQLHPVGDSKEGGMTQKTAHLGAPVDVTKRLFHP